MLVQIVVGIPLEMVHGSFRILIVYLAGVVAGEIGFLHPFSFFSHTEYCH